MPRLTFEEKEFIRHAVKDALADLHLKRQRGATNIKQNLTVAESAWEKLKRGLE